MFRNCHVTFRITAYLAVMVQTLSHPKIAAEWPALGTVILKTKSSVHDPTFPGRWSLVSSQQQWRFADFAVSCHPLQAPSLRSAPLLLPNRTSPLAKVTTRRRKERESTYDFTLVTCYVFLPSSKAKRRTDHRREEACGEVADSAKVGQKR